MRKTRFILAALAVPLVTLMSILLPSPASAASNTTPMDSLRSSETVGILALEVDQAVAGTPPSGLPCISITGAIACFDADGDQWWVKDTAADSASAEVDWDNYLNGSLYRSGICRNSLGANTWGVCNKNYYEDSYIEFLAAVYDASEGVYVRWSDVYYVYA